MPEAALILIVDDERPIRELLTFVLRDAGYRTAAAVNGADALALIAERPPHLILADVMMPMLGGEELCRRVKAGAHTATVPVVLMSAVRYDSSAPADAFLRKPFDLGDVEAMVGRLLAQSRTTTQP